jgi:carbon-monoxide dehydrogenase medium subunit
MNEMTNSHILVHSFDLYEPTTLDETISLLTELDGRARVLAGGTDLLVHLKMERTAPAALVSVQRVPGLDTIEVTPTGQLRIGAAVTIKRLAASRSVQSQYPALAEACIAFSTTQVQTMGTLGGNLANGSPAADTAPALLGLAASVELTGPDGRRILPLEQFFIGPGRTALRRAELITAVLLPQSQAQTGSAFLKIGRVAADLAKASAAVYLQREGSHVGSCRLAFGSVGPVPMRTPRAEQALSDQPWSEELIHRVAQIAAEEVTPIDDVRSTADYRRQVVAALAHDALLSAWHRAGATPPPISAVPFKGEQAAAAITPVPTPMLPCLSADEKRLVDLRINGRAHRVWVGPNELLLNVLREQLELTGTKYGCGIGECSACTVLMDGQPVLACLVLAATASGHDIRTIEGLARPGGELDPLQESFLDYAAYQCGYCTPGMLLTAKSLLAEAPHPSEDDVRYYLRGNMCRCTGYASVVRAVLAAATDQ